MANTRRGRSAQASKKKKTNKVIESISPAKTSPAPLSDEELIELFKKKVSPSRKRKERASRKGLQLLLEQQQMYLEKAQERLHVDFENIESERKDVSDFQESTHCLKEVLKGTESELNILFRSSFEEMDTYHRCKARLNTLTTSLQSQGGAHTVAVEEYIQKEEEHLRETYENISSKLKSLGKLEEHFSKLKKKLDDDEAKLEASLKLADEKVRNYHLAKDNLNKMSANLAALRSQEDGQGSVEVNSSEGRQSVTDDQASPQSAQKVHFSEDSPSGNLAIAGEPGSSNSDLNKQDDKEDSDEESDEPVYIESSQSSYKDIPDLLESDDVELHDLEEISEQEESGEEDYEEEKGSATPEKGYSDFDQDSDFDNNAGSRRVTTRLALKSKKEAAKGQTDKGKSRSSSKEKSGPQTRKQKKNTAKRDDDEEELSGDEDDQETTESLQKKAGKSLAELMRLATNPICVLKGSAKLPTVTEANYSSIEADDDDDDGSDEEEKEEDDNSLLKVPVNRQSTSTPLLLQSAMDYIKASMTHVYQSNQISLEGRTVTPAAALIRNELLKEREQKAEQILMQASDTLKAFLHAATKSENVTKEQLLSFKSDNAIDTQDGGIYIWGALDKKTENMRWCYIGRADNFSDRNETHMWNIKHAEEGTKLETRMVKFARESEKRGDFIFNKVLLRLPEADRNESKEVNDKLRELLLLWEPTLCALFGSYRKNEAWLKRRLDLGLPQFSAQGANGNQCFDGSGNKVAVNEGSRASQNKLRSIRYVWHQYAIAQCVQYRANVTREEIEVAAKKAANFEKLFDQLSIEYRDICFKELLNGTYASRLRSNSSRTCWNLGLFQCSLREELVLKRFGEQVVKDARQTSSLLSCYLRIRITDNPNPATDLFSVLTPYQSCLVGGIQLEWSLNEKFDDEVPQLIHLPTPIKFALYNKVRFFDFIFSHLPSTIKEERQQRANNLPRISREKSIKEHPELAKYPQMVWDLLNSEVYAVAFKNYGTGNTSDGCFGARGHEKDVEHQHHPYIKVPLVGLPNTKEIQDRTKDGHRSAYLGMDPASSDLIWPNAKGLLGEIGLTVFYNSPIDSAFVPITKGYIEKSGKVMKCLVHDALAVWIALGRPNLVTMECYDNEDNADSPEKKKSGRTSSSKEDKNKHAPPQNRPGEPFHFVRRQKKG